MSTPADPAAPRRSRSRRRRGPGAGTARPGARLAVLAGLPALIGLLVLAGAPTGPVAPAPAGAAVTAAHLAPGTETVALSFQGRQRSYIVHVPPEARAGAPLPLVLNLHGATSNAVEEEAYSAMDTTADHDGFVVVYPNGTPVARGATTQLGWDAGECCGLPATSHVDDVGFLLHVITDVAARTPVDRSRVYVTGISNGGMMSYAMAAEASDHIAAAASVSGQVELPAIRPARPVAVLEFHSVDDPIARWAGVPGPVSSGYRLPAVLTGVHQWVRADRCRSTPSTGRPIVGAPGSADAGETAVLLTWTGCRRGTSVELWRFTGSGHVWPGSPIDLSHVRAFGSPLGRSIDLVNADQQIWQFFSHHRLAG